MLTLDFDTSIELLCCITAILCLSKDKNRVWKSFSIYLVITCLTELTALYLTRHHRQNAWLYNILILFEMSFTSLMFGELFNKYIKSKKLIKWGFLLFAVTYVAETISNIYNKGITGILHFNNLTNEVMSVLFVCYALYYFYLLLKDDSYTDLRISASFWWVIGVLLFYFGSTAINLYRGFDINNQKLPVAKSGVAAINKLVNDTVKTEHLKNAFIARNDSINHKSVFFKNQNEVPATKSNNVKTQKEKLTEFILGVFITLLYACWTYSFICKRWLTTSAS